MEYKGFSFPKDLPIFFSSPFRIIFIKIKIKKTGYNQILLQFGKNDLYKIADGVFITSLEKQFKALTFFLHKIFKDSNLCMTRTVLLYEDCAKNKIKARIMTGFYKNTGKLYGHCWLEINGKPICEDRESLSKYTVISEV